MEYKWVLARYRSTDETGKKCVELAENNVGYHIINKDRAKNEDVILAFKFIQNKPLPIHLCYASDAQVKKLEELDQKRKGMIRKSGNIDD